MAEVLLLAVALAMDAFAVAIGLGAKYQFTSTNTQSLTLKMAILDIFLVKDLLLCAAIYYLPNTFILSSN